MITKSQLIELLREYPGDATIIPVKDVEGGIDYIPRDKFIIIDLMALGNKEGS